MNTELIRKGTALLLLLAIGYGPVLADDSRDKDKDRPVVDKPADRQPAKDDRVAGNKSPGTMPVYVPPMRGAPVARVGGGTRGVGDELPYVSVVTPEHTGHTSSPQPVLYWYLSEAVDTRFEFALINDDEIEPIIEIATQRKMQKGLNFLDMSEHGVLLKPGIIYQWSVALVGQPEKRSSDIVSSGTIELVELNDGQRAALAGAGASEAVMIFAREGYWYDTFTALSRMIDANPGDSSLVDTRKALLRQVGLDEVADAGQ